MNKLIIDNKYLDMHKHGTLTTIPYTSILEISLTTVGSDDDGYSDVLTITTQKTDYRWSWDIFCSDDAENTILIRNAYFMLRTILGELQ